MSSAHNKQEPSFIPFTSESYGLSVALGCIVMFSVCAVLFIIFRTLRDRRRKQNERVEMETDALTSPDKVVGRKKRNRSTASTGKWPEPVCEAPGFTEGAALESLQSASGPADPSACLVYVLDKPTTECTGESLPEQVGCVAEGEGNLVQVLGDGGEDQNKDSVLDDHHEPSQGQCVIKEHMVDDSTECQQDPQFHSDTNDHEQDAHSQEDEGEGIEKSTDGQVTCLGEAATPVMTYKEAGEKVRTVEVNEDLDSHQGERDGEQPCSTLPRSVGADGNSDNIGIMVMTKSEVESWSVKTESKVTAQSCVGNQDIAVVYPSNSANDLSACVARQCLTLPENFPVVCDLKVKDVELISEKPAESVTKLLGNHDPAEINIMEATMDNNEWMGLGAEVKSGLTGLNVNEPPGSFVPERSVEDSRSSHQSYDGHLEGKSVATVHPLSHTVSVQFCVHYVTHSPSQLLAVTGNSKELGNWDSFVPLWQANGGFWSSSVALPVDSHVEWKFVLVENGKISRWEECSNRCFYTGCGEDVSLHKWWGYI